MTLELKRIIRIKIDYTQNLIASINARTELACIEDERLKSFYKGVILGLKEALEAIDNISN